MFRIIRIIISLLLVLASAGFTTSLGFPTLPNYLAKTPVIAEGHIKFTDGKSILLVDSFLKGTASKTIIITYEPQYRPSLRVADGDRVILFLSQLNSEGTKAFLSGGYMSMWPKDPKYPYFGKTYSTSDIDRFSIIIDTMNSVLSGNNFKDQVQKIISMMRSDDEMMQYAGLQITSSTVFRNILPKSNRYELLGQIAAYALPLFKSNNPEIRIEAAEVVKYAPISIAVPAIISLLSDSGLDVAYRAAIILNSMFTKVELSMPHIASSTPERPSDLSYLKTDDGRQQARIQCELLWDEKVDVQMIKDLERLRKSLESGSDLEKESAKIFIDILEGTTLDTK